MASLRLQTDTVNSSLRDQAFPQHADLRPPVANQPRQGGGRPSLQQRPQGRGIKDSVAAALLILTMGPASQNALLNESEQHPCREKT